MNKLFPVAKAVIWIGFSGLIRYFIIRGVLRKMKKPVDDQKQTILAAALTVITAVPEIDRQRRLPAGSQPVRVQ